MNVTSSTQTQSTQKTDKKDLNEEVIDPLKGQNYVLNTLDEEGNELLNEALADNTDEEKWFIKLALDLSLSHEIKDGTLKRISDIDNSKSNAISKLEEYVKMQRDLGNSDMNGAISVAEKLLVAWKSKDSFSNFENTEESPENEYIEELYSKEAIDFKSTVIKDEIEQKINEYAQLMLEERKDETKSELENAKLLNQYKNELLQEYRDSLENSKENSLNAQQQAIIKVLLDENVEETSSLEELLAATTETSTMQKTKVTKETRTPEEIIAEYRAMPGQAGVFVEGMFEEQKAAALLKHEPYFKAEYEHYEKYQDIFTPIYSNYTTEKANNIGRDLNAQFPEFKAMREKAYMGGTEQDKEAFEDMFWDYQAYNKYLREKYDMDFSSTGFNATTKESSKAYNFAVYDSLESGMSIEEATKKANGLLSSFGGREAQAFTLMFFSGLPEDIEEAMQIPEHDIDYDKQIDLRDYGFEHNFWSDAYLNTYGNDSIGEKSRIMYDVELYSFLLENDDVVNKKLDELKERAYETENGTDWYDGRNEDGKFNERFKRTFQSKYDNAVYANEIYEKYADKIYDHTIIDSVGNTEESDIEQEAS
ncbi:MAG: hypothetical protein GQ570_06610 [Helicobacteraceae bacterium]|nr:hypothetical protein [Helicobacteraceae bacterium]